MRTAYLLESHTIAGWMVMKEIYWDIEHAKTTANLLLTSRGAMRVKIFRVIIPATPDAELPGVVPK